MVLQLLEVAVGAHEQVSAHGGGEAVADAPGRAPFARVQHALCGVSIEVFDEHILQGAAHGGPPCTGKTPAPAGVLPVDCELCSRTAKRECCTRHCRVLIKSRAACEWGVRYWGRPGASPRYTQFD